MVRHYGLLIPPDEEMSPASIEQIDAALVVLRESDNLSERRAAFPILKSVPREVVAERMRVVRPLPDGITDPMGQSLIHPVPPHVHHKKVIILQCTGGYQGMCQRLIDTLKRFSRCDDALFVVFAGDDGAWQYFKGRHNILTIRTTRLAKPRTWVKAAVWCAASLINADKFLILESDMLCTGDLSGIWGAMDVADERTIFGAKGQFHHGFISLRDELFGCGNPATDLQFVTGNPVNKTEYGHFMFNGGILAGTKLAISRVEQIMRSHYPFATLAAEGSGIPYADELYTMAAIAQSGFYSFLHPSFNKHLYFTDDTNTKVHQWNHEVRAGELHNRIQNQSAKLLHFVAGCKHSKMSEMQELLDTYPLAE